MYIYVFGTKLLRRNFLQISQLSIGSGGDNLFSRFLDIKRRQNSSKYEQRAGGPERDKHTKTYKNIFAPTAGAPCSIFPSLSTVIEDVEIIKKVSIIFRTNV